jgi:hypothetical protein
MFLSTKGKPANAPLQLCKKALKWYGLKLLGTRLYNIVTINLIFTKEDMGSDIYAYCDWNDSNHRAREFTIAVRPDLSKKQTLLALAHEMVHVKQYARGELKDYLRTNRCKWKGEYYDEDMWYWELPWEIEAHGREKGLYISFNEIMRSLK